MYVGCLEIAVKGSTRIVTFLSVEGFGKRGLGIFCTAFSSDGSKTSRRLSVATPSTVRVLSSY